MELHSAWFKILFGSWLLVVQGDYVFVLVVKKSSVGRILQ